MKNDTHPNTLIERLAALEARIASLEGRWAAPVVSGRPKDEPEDIPWAVITVAVAAVIPGAFRINAVSVAIPLPLNNWWGLEGRAEIFRSHRIR